MFKVGTNIIGIGKCGIECINRSIVMGFTGARFITVSGIEYNSEAEFCYQTKNEFMGDIESHYMSGTSTSIVVADVAVPSDAALACEICAISSMKKALTIAFVHVPCSTDEMYESAKGYIEELHEVCNSVVVINDGYTDNFACDFTNFLIALSSSLDVNADKRIANYEEMCTFFTHHNDMHFAYVKTNTATDSHKFKAKCVSLKLEHQLHLDIANHLIYIIASNGEVPKSIMSEYVTATDSRNVACLPVKKLCISNSLDCCGEGEFLFAVICAE